MSDSFDQLLSQYERGHLSRRQLLLAMAAIAAAPSTQAASQSPIGTVRQLNHVTIFVPDVKKSVRFYQELLGMPVLTEQSPGMNLNAGNGFLGIYPAQAASGSIHHFCLGMDNFDADAVLKTLTERGVEANIRMRGETKELYFTDPDGVRVQLQDVKYKGGVGVLGDRDPP